MRNRSLTIVVALGVVLAFVAPVAAASVGDTSSETVGEPIETGSFATPENSTATNATNTSLSPGAQLSGIVGIQQAELAGEVETRSFGIAIAKAKSNASKVGVVGEQIERIRTRLDELKERKRALKRMRRNGSISLDQFKAQMAELAVKSANLKRLASQATNVSRGLPADLLREKGINVSAIRTLKNNAANLTGPQVAKIARSIAGPGIGKTIARNKTPGGVGPPGKNETVPPVAKNKTGPRKGNDTGRGVNETSPRKGNETKPEKGQKRTETGSNRNTSERTGPSKRTATPERTQTPRKTGGSERTATPDRTADPTRTATPEKTAEPTATPTKGNGKQGGERGQSSPSGSVLVGTLAGFGLLVTSRKYDGRNR